MAEGICTNAHLGFRGMRERVSQPGGNLTMESNSGVTTVVATFLISIAATTSNEELAVVLRSNRAETQRILNQSLSRFQTYWNVF